MSDKYYLKNNKYPTYNQYNYNNLLMVWGWFKSIFNF